jgi:hypothetical protein
MSDYQTNQDIIIFMEINFLYNNPKLNPYYKPQVDIIFNNLINYKCSYAFNKLNTYSIIGIPNNINDVTSYTYMIPNLFRECFIRKSVAVPCICPSFLYIYRITFYLPYLINTNLMKSFLYFAFSTDIKTYTPENIKTFTEYGIAYRLNYINTITKNTTYGSLTPASVIFGNIYPNNSLIRQLLKLNYKINLAEYAEGQSQIIKPFTIPWNYTTHCTDTNGIINQTDIFGNDGLSLNITTLKNMFSLLNSNTYTLGIVLQNTTITNLSLLENSIFNVLKITNEVYQDILVKINFYTLGKCYIDKDYMALTNLPELYELYTNYYNNQIYVNSQVNLSVSS